jgi:hypothetical protein
MSATPVLREAARIVSEADTKVELSQIESDHSITLPNPRVKEFKRHLRKKRRENAPYNPEHNFSRYHAEKKFCQVKDVGRYFWRNYDQFTTVHIVRTADENDAPLIDQTNELTPSLYTQRRRELPKSLDTDFARVSVLAPKFPASSDKSVRSHIHEGFWIPGLHEAERFEPLRKKHHEKVPGSTSVSITVRHHSTDEESPVVYGKDKSRGGTSALPYELAGANQPLMDTERDALDLHDERAIVWFATLWAGSNGSHTTRGMSYIRKNKNAVEYEKAVENGMRRQVYRKVTSTQLPHQIQESESNVMPELDGSPATPEPMKPRIERQFIDDYCREVGNPSPSVIRENIADNMDVLNSEEAEQIVANCRGKLRN